MSDKWGIARRIKILRGELSQGKFAQKLGVSQAYISDLELMKKIPSVVFLLALKKLFDVTVDWILEGDTNNSAAGQPQGLPMIPINQIRRLLKNAEDSWANGEFRDNQITQAEDN